MFLRKKDASKCLTPLNTFLVLKVCHELKYSNFQFGLLFSYQYDLVLL